MKRVKGRFDDLQHLVDGISVEDVAVSDLVVCQPSSVVRDVLADMESMDIDIVPIDDAGARTEYVERRTLAAKRGESTIAEVPRRRIEVSDLVAMSSPLRNTVGLLASRTWLFTLNGNRITGIVTRGDLQRPPMRMYLFGLLSLFEANLLRAIQIEYPKDEWQDLPGFPRNLLEGARSARGQRGGSDEAPLSLSECLMFRGRMAVVRLTPAWHEPLRLDSSALFQGQRRGDPKDCLEDLVELRNNLDHADDLTQGFPNRWADVFLLVERLESMTESVEGLVGREG